MRRSPRAITLILVLLGITVLSSRARLFSPSPPAPDRLAEMPREKGLPVRVQVALQYLDVSAIDENEEAFTGTVDLRLRWIDPRLAYPKAEAPSGFREWRGEALDTQLAAMWTPAVTLANLDEEQKDRRRGLRLFPDGRVELMQRVSGRFATALDMERFPFDRQALEVQVVCVADGITEVALEARRDDLEWSNEKVGLQVTGWDPGVVDVRSDRLAGWHGESHARLRVQLQALRHPGTAVGPIFIPLFASLLIPLLAIWLNRSEDGTFQIEAFELSNVIVGGLFAVIALNFTVNAEYRALSGHLNVVTALFALNYLTLAVSLVVNMALFRFNVVRRLWGPHVQEEVYMCVGWAVPLLAFGAAAAFVAAAMA